MSPEARTLGLLLGHDEATGEVPRRILDAAYALFLESGLRRTTMDDVARQAGVGRATVYRAYADKDALIQAVMLRECVRAMRSIEQRLLRIPDVERRFVESMVIVALEARQHPLIQRLFELEPEWLLPHLTTLATPIHELSRGYMVGQMRLLQEKGHFAHLNAEAASELLLRLLHSLVLTPSSLLSTNNEASLRHYAEDFLLPLLTRSSS